MSKKRLIDTLKFERILFISMLIINITGLGFILSLMYSEYDSFFHSPKTSFIMSLVGAFIGSTICILVICKKLTPIEKFSTSKNLSKVNTMILLLLSSNLFLCSVQYIIYSQNKSDFVTGANVHNEINSEINKFESLSVQYDSLRMEYIYLLGKIKLDSVYHFANKSKTVFIDSLELNVKLIAGVTSSTKVDARKKIVSIRNANVGFPNDPSTNRISRRIRTPQVSLGVRSSSEKDMRILLDTTSFISGELLNKAVNDKISNIDIDIDNMHNIIKGITDRGISFTAFAFRSLESRLGDISPKSYYVRMLFYIQILLSIFIWGYVTIVMYRIFDGK